MPGIRPAGQIFIRCSLARGVRTARYTRHPILFVPDDGALKSAFETMPTGINRADA
jgi:hypothetical protein